MVDLQSNNPSFKLNIINLQIKKHNHKKNHK
jgi:hypothetical protein